MSQSDASLLSARIGSNLAVKIVIAVLVVVMHAVIESNGATSSNTDSGFILLVPASIAISALVLRALGHLHSSRNFPIGFTFEPDSSVTEFPWWSLGWDFINLAFLVVFTGGLQSVFLPLFVIGLLLGDVSVAKNKRELITVIFLITTAGSLLVSQVDVARCVLLWQGNAECAKSVWHLSPGWEIASALLIYIPGALFGSIVLRWYIDIQGNP
jgi:hypothetical protein